MIWNQLKPVLESSLLMKMAKIPTLNTDFIHFQLKFIKDFYISRILGCPRSLWCQWLQDSSSIKGEKYCPQEMVVSIQFCLHINLRDLLINNIKTIFL